MNSWHTIEINSPMLWVDATPCKITLTLSLHSSDADHVLCCAAGEASVQHNIVSDDDDDDNDVQKCQTDDVGNAQTREKG